MGNDFLDNYKKKADSEFGGASSAPSAQPSMPTPTPTPAPAPTPVSPQSRPMTQPAQNTASSTEKPQQVLPVVPEASQEKALNFEQQSSFKKPAYSHTTYPNSGGGGKQKKFPLKYIIIAAVAVVAVIILVLLLGGGTAVPSMVGWTDTDAELWGRENEITIRITEEYFDNIPAGEVVEQTPPEGQELSSGDFIELIISLGPDPEVEVMIPDIMNMTMDEVEDWAEQNYMTAVRIVTEDSETVEIGKVIEFSVNDNTVLGDTIKRNTPFYVVFSRGAGEGEAVKVPNFLTMSLTEAEKFASDNEIILVVKEIFHDTITKGQIISQSVKAEESVYEGDTIELEVSSGKEIIVPNFFLYDEDRGAAEALKLGITLHTDSRYGSTAEGKLLSQSIAAGTLYETGDVVELVYSLGNSIVIPSFVGKNESEIRTWIDPYNEKGASLSVRTTYTSSDKAPGTVLSQDKIDYTIGYTDYFSIVVSKGPVIYAPSFVAPIGSSYADIITREKAIALCNTAGIVPVFVEEYSAGRQAGEVWYQSVAAGSEIQQGASITLKYNPMVNLTVPDFLTDTTLNTRTLIEGSNWVSTMSVIFVEQIDAATPGTVLAQSLPAGSSVAPGTEITITVAIAAPASP